MSEIIWQTYFVDLVKSLHDEVVFTLVGHLNLSESNMFPFFEFNAFRIPVREPFPTITCSSTLWTALITHTHVLIL